MRDFFDIHTHILYGLDDGASDILQTERILDRAYQAGTRAVIFTPHCKDKSFDIELVNERLLSLRPIISKYRDLKVYGGSEILYNTDTAQMLEEGIAPTLANSNYVLIEFVPTVGFGEVAIAIQDLMTSGFTPILAHLERYPLLFKEDISELVKTGALIQLNARSILGEHGYSIKRFCNKLLKNGLVHFIASDSHDEDTRLPELDRCASYVAKKYGEPYAQKLFKTNGERLIKNEFI